LSKIAGLAKANSYVQYPFHIFRTDGEPMTLAGLYLNSKFYGQTFTTLSTVTCKGNDLLAQIHNNPKLFFGPRIPVILPDNNTAQWLIILSFKFHILNKKNQKQKTDKSVFNLWQLVKPEH